MSATPNINPLKIIGNVLNKFDATSAPTAGDDSADGYSVGSVWIDVSANKAHTCVDATAGAAIWNEAGGGGNTIYTGDDSLTGDRVVNLNDNKLEITGGTINNSEPINFEFNGTWNGYTRWNNFGELEVKGSGNGKTLSVYKKIDASNPNFVSKSGGGGHLGTDGGVWTVGQTYGSSSTRLELTNIAFKQFYTNTEYHRLQMGGGSNSGAYFFRPGFGSLGGFVVGGTSVIGTENISLQGETVIKGNGTTTGTTLALYDDDTTPNKTWEWLDNGNLNLNQTSAIISTQPDILKFNSSGANPSVYINATSGTNNSSLVFQNQNNNKWLFGNEGSSGAFRIRNLVSIKNIISISSGNVFNFNESSITSAKFNIGGDLYVNASSQVSATFKGTSNTYVNIDNGSSAVGCSLGYSTNGSLKWLTGYEGGTGSFRIRNIANASNPILISSSNAISLQGTTSISDTLNMNNNRILNSVVNPSVQEATNSATFTINADEQTDGVLTAMSANTTIAAPTGTPVQCQDLVFRFKDDGTARTLTWNAVFRAIGVTLPTTTVANKLTYVGCKYNSTDTKWDVVAVQQEA